MPTIGDAEEFIAESGTVASHLATAQALIDDYIGGSDVPSAVYDNCCFQLAQELQLRQRSPGGVTMFAGAEVPSRVGKDPMASLYPILDHYVTGIA